MDERPDRSPEAADKPPEVEARRAFLKNAGRFAAVTPPAIALLLGTSLNSRAIAGSVGSKPCHGGSKPGHGYGDKNHKHSGPPGQNKSKSNGKH